MFFCESNEPEPVCPICGSHLKHYDYKFRNMKLEGGIVKVLKIRRLLCPCCHALHNELPDCLSPYKHYATEVIEGALEGIVNPFDEESEDYPSTDSIKRWKSWLYEIRKLLFVTIRTRWSLIPDNILKLVLSNSLLLSFREELRYNWLQILLKLIYNYLQPFY